MSMIACLVGTLTDLYMSVTRAGYPNLYEFPLRETREAER